MSIKSVHSVVRKKKRTTFAGGMRMKGGIYETYKSLAKETRSL